jgi:glycosyltransferase involved in cell wall biosynthesis
MKILYITVPSFFDLDVSLIRELSKFVEINVLLVVSPQSIRSSAFSINNLKKECDVFSAIDYEEIHKYDKIIDKGKWFVANNPDNSFLSCLKLSQKIKKFIRTNHFDLIHTTSSCKTILFLTTFLSAFKNTLLTVHDPISHNKLSWMENFIRRTLFYKANKNILLLSKALLTQFSKKYGIEKRRIFFSSLGIYDILKQFAANQNDYGQYVLFFGRIEPYKGVNVLIEAYKKSNLPKEGVKLVIAGKGNINHNESDIPKDVVLINRFIENDELANLISHCRYVVLPYLSATQSGCVMSAYAFNKPVLATDVGDFPLTIENLKTGMICKANDVDSLSDTLNEMTKSNLDVMEKNINDKYQDDGPFSWCFIAKSLSNTYSEIIST